MEPLTPRRSSAMKPPLVKPPFAKPPLVKPPFAKPPLAKPPLAEPPLVKPPLSLERRRRAGGAARALGIRRRGRRQARGVVGHEVDLPALDLLDDPADRLAVPLEG